jgi:diguanylate cyclase (GGDEF)-like protein
MTKTSSADLLPLAERLRVMRVLRVVIAAIVLAAWAGVPASRGASLGLVLAITGGWLVAQLAIDVVWTVAARRAQWLFGLMLMADAVYLAWVSYGTAGLGTPLRTLVLLQLITVALIASMRTGMKLAMWSSLLLVGAYHLQELGLLTSLGNPHVRFGADGYRQMLVDVTIYWLVTMATAGFSAVNERELRRRRYDLEALAALSLRLESATEAKAVAAALVDEIGRTFDYERVLVAAGRDEGLRVLAMRGIEAPDGPLESPLVGRALRASRPLLVAGAGDDPLLGRVFGGARNLALLALHAEGRAIGVVVVEHGLRGGSRIEARVVTMLERFTSHAALALANAWLLDEVRRNATTDALTGLANRRRLDESLARECAEAARTGEPLAVLMVDVDHFKQLNDRHGPQEGDRVLRLVAMAIASATRAMDVPARYGGEEFCVIMPGATARDAAAVGERVRRTIADVSPDLPVTASVGVAAAPEHGGSATELTAAADAALYDAKRGGRNQVVVSRHLREAA